MNKKHCPYHCDGKTVMCDGQCDHDAESSRSASCSIAIKANERLIAIYEAEAVESAMHLMRKLNRGQISKIRLLDSNLADLYAESLSN